VVSVADKIVGQHTEGHLGGDLRQRLRQEEMALVTFGMTARFYLGWYVSRTLAVAVSTVVLVALLSEVRRLHSEVLKAKMVVAAEWGRPTPRN
jgi:hypothetical protein